MKIEKITLTRALVELKMLDKRISAKSITLRPIIVATGDKLPAEIKSKEDFTKKVKADYQSVQDLIQRRAKIKSALVNANAVTKIKVADKEMTIAEAIERKNSIGLEKDLLSHLKQSYADSVQKVERENAAMKGQLLKLLEATYSKSETEIDKDDYEKVAKPFKENNEATLVDPLNLKDLIAEMELSIESFETDVDVSLSEINAQVEIEI